MADPMRRQEALRIVYGIQTTSVRRRTPPGMLGLRKAVWAWFRQVLTDEERAMVFCLVDRQWCLFVKDLFQSNADKNCDGVFDCARLLDSRCGYDTLTLSKELLRNPVAAEAVLTDVSAGRFLTHQPPRDTITGMPRSMALQARRKGWSEYHRFAAPTSPASGAGCLPWYLSLPAHTVGSIVAHRLELALWHAFWEWQSTLHRAARPLLPRIPETGVAATRHPHDAAAAPAAATASTAAAAAAGAAPPYWCWCGRGRGMP
ncbi:hypothetical protein FNF29_02030 [Cafeteria roenbergensis]|uniref:Uncharacterized protein n=1 Tax=Cafeteria roenbergensis TaxID=33653 RepID=A0A5A8CQC6_CAFRO|nr:hypothetical protein FNF29_02030 [Cafeteria roenbergensis]|eukprot:KAA0154889.1 hypothetical protein FNF29_02030 [Cafeteria roenbergensis]